MSQPPSDAQQSKPYARPPGVPYVHRRRWRLPVGLGLLVVLSTGGYYIWCYYKVLDLEYKLPHAFDRLYMFRGSARVRADKIRKRALARLRAKKARFKDEDLTVVMEPLTRTNASRLPAMQREKLSLACYMQRIEDVRDWRIKHGKEEALVGHRLAGNRPSTKAPPLRPGGHVVCASSRLRFLNYTFVEVAATVRLTVGWVTHKVRVERRFYLAQHPLPASKAKESPGKDDDQGADSAGADDDVVDEDE